MPKSPSPSTEFPYIEELGILRQGLNQWTFSLRITILVNIILLGVFITMCFKEPSRIFVEGPKKAGLTYPEWPEGRFDFRRSKLDEISKNFLKDIK